MKAIWKDTVIAESDKTVEIENNQYFPNDSIIEKYFEESTTHTVCPWKGTASYLTINVNGEKNEDAAWYYNQPSEAAARIKDYVAFWKGVSIVE